MNKLLVVWKSDNDIDINNFITPFAYNSKTQGWFDDVEVLIWGASAHKIKEDKNAQEKVVKLVSSGALVFACKYCADQTESTEILESLGVTVIYTGVYLSDKMKDPDYKVITI